MDVIAALEQIHLEALVPVMTGVLHLVYGQLCPANAEKVFFG